MAAITFASKTDKGHASPTNDDSLIALGASDLNGAAEGLFIVADGMGGRPSGDVASKVTVETMPSVVLEHLASLSEAASQAQVGDALQKALEAANDLIKLKGDESRSLKGMGTTCAALLLKGEAAVIANIGDSRVYLLRDGQFSLLSQDHALIQPSRHGADSNPERGTHLHNVVTRGIGLSAKVEAYIAAGELREGDTFLLCSDGLSGVVPETDVQRILEREEDIQKACDRLVSEANRRGGPDNISVIVVRCGAFTAPAGDAAVQNEGEQPVAAKPRGGLCSLVLGLSLIAVIYGFWLISAFLP